MAYLRPNWAKTVADLVREQGGRPFLSDANTLYVGRRKDALEHLDAAYENGFNPFATGCQVLIADGLKGTDEELVPVAGGEYVKEAKIGRAFMPHILCAVPRSAKSTAALGACVAALSARVPGLYYGSDRRVLTEAGDPAALDGFYAPDDKADLRVRERLDENGMNSASTSWWTVAAVSVTSKQSSPGTAPLPSTSACTCCARLRKKSAAERLMFMLVPPYATLLLRV